MTVETGRTARKRSESLLLENARLRELYERSEAAASQNARLLREGDHRIKNSLQIVASLMQLQARRESGTARDALRTAAARVQSIARIHDALQASGGEDSVDLGAVLQTMCQSLQAMAGEPCAVVIIANVEPIHAPVALAQPIALAVNELVVNALRHAFPDHRAGRINVDLIRHGAELRVVVADNGDGLPADHAQTRGYGMKFVDMMAAQVGGTFVAENDSGARFTLTTPAPTLAPPMDGDAAKPPAGATDSVPPASGQASS
jgi:two-component sensor histidine kinase